MQKITLIAILPLESSLYRLEKFAISVGQVAKHDFKVTFDNMNHRFFDFIKLHFQLVQRPKLSWENDANPWNIAFSTSPKSHFRLAKRPKMRSKWHVTPWNIAFPNLPKSHFGLIKVKKMSSQWLATTRNIVFSTTSKSNLGFSRASKYFKCHLPFESSIYQLEKSRIFGWSRSKKWLKSDVWQLESSLFRRHQISFSASPEDENNLKMPFENLKHCFFELIQVAFWDGQEAELEFKVTWDPLKIAFSTSPKSHVRLVKRKKMSFQWLATTWIIAFSSSSNCIFS